MKENLVLGTRDNWGSESDFGLSADDRRHHLYVIGKSGTGKTTLLRNLILQDIEAGRGVAVIDPHGDLADDVLDHIPRRRIEDVMHFDPADMEHPVGFNLLGSVPTDDRHLVASGIVDVFKSIWPDFWGPRLEYILYATVAALLDCDNVQSPRNPADALGCAVSNWVWCGRVKDPMVRSFWENEFASYGKQFLHEAIAPIQNKVGQLLMSPHSRNILGQVRSKIDARFMINLGASSSPIFPRENSARTRRISWVRYSSRNFSLRPCRAPTHAGKTSAGISSSTSMNFSRSPRTHSRPSSRKRESTACASPLPISTSIKCGLASDKLCSEAAGSIIAFRVGHADAKVLEQAFGEALSLPAQLTSLNNHEVHSEAPLDRARRAAGIPTAVRCTPFRHAARSARNHHPSVAGKIRRPSADHQKENRRMANQN